MSGQDNRLKSYSPYSGQEESCFIEGESGLFYPGVRIENISYPLTISSVQAALCSCLANGDRPVRYYSERNDPELLQWWAFEYGFEIIRNLPEKSTHYNPVIKPSEIPSLPAFLEELTSDAVTTHSNFPVSALILTASGYVSGVNVEVPAWSMGLCAERVALARAVSHGLTTFYSISIFAPRSEFCSPCGACRQVLSEFMPDATAELHHSTVSLSRHFISDLLPYSIITYALKK